MALYNLLILFALPGGLCCSLLIAAMAFRKKKHVSTTLLGPKHTGHLDAVRDALNTLLTGAQLQEITDMFS